MNQKSYNEYAITGFPCHFFTIEAADKYNSLIRAFASAKSNKDDLGVLQKIIRRIYIVYLNIYDVLLYESRHKRNKKVC